ERVDLKIVLLEADNNLSDVVDSPYLAEIPTDEKTLLEFDLIVPGDVDVRQIPAETRGTIERFVSEFGGGLAVIAGRRHGLSGYRETGLEKLLPVDLAGDESATFRVGVRDDRAAATEPIHVELTTAGARDAMLQLADTLADSASIWAEFPPI